jgi:hypothetical protein
MAESRKVVKVFLASPGDLADERRLAKGVVDEINSLLGEMFGIYVELVGWEDTVTAFGRPQATINLELERCELFVGMLWQRWGTPPDSKGDYTSGFEEEFKTSIARRVAEGRPEISLFFKEIDKKLLSDPGVGLQKVIDFRNQVITDKQILFETFSDDRTFESKLRRKIVRYVQNLQISEQVERSVQSEVSSVSDALTENSTSTASKNDDSHARISLSGRNFIGQFIQRLTDASDDALDPVSVARFRLIAQTLTTQHNDTASLGVHDSNLLFLETGNDLFSRSEIYALFANGVDHFKGSNVPIWKWLTKLDGFKENLLSYNSAFGTSTERRIACIEAMRVIGEVLPSDKDFSREDLVGTWFSDASDSALKIVALKYLAEFGVPSDLGHAKNEFDANNYASRSVAAEAIINIRRRNSRSDAISALYELQSTSTSWTVLVELFGNASALPPALLSQGLGHQDARVRYLASSALKEQRALTTDQTTKLLADADARVRLIALEASADAGVAYTEPEAKKILVRDENPQEIGLLRLGGLSTDEGKKCFERFQRNRFLSMTAVDLKEACSAHGVLFDPVAYVCLVEKYPKQNIRELRINVDDGFNKFVSSRAEKLKLASSNNSETRESIERLIPYWKDTFLKLSVVSLSKIGGPEDLLRIRAAEERKVSSFPISFVEYLGKFGEWNDIDLIIRYSALPLDNEVRTFDPDTDEFSISADAILNIGVDRFSELVKLKMGWVLKSVILARCSDKAFNLLSDSDIQDLLNSPDAEVRRVTALKLVKIKSKKILGSILQIYVQGSTFFYNVSHWLDLGISVPRPIASAAVARLLNARRRKGFVGFGES